LRSRWTHSNSEATPGIWTCVTRPLARKCTCVGSGHKTKTAHGSGIQFNSRVVFESKNDVTVYSFFFAWLRGETALGHVGPRFAPASYSRQRYEFPLRRGEKVIHDIAFSGEYTGIFLEVLVQHIMVIRGSQPPGAAGFNFGRS